MGMYFYSKKLEQTNMLRKYSNWNQNFSLFLLVIMLFIGCIGNNKMNKLLEDKW